MIFYCTVADLLKHKCGKKYEMIKRKCEDVVRLLGLVDKDFGCGHPMDGCGECYRSKSSASVPSVSPPPYSKEESKGRSEKGPEGESRREPEGKC